MFACCCSLMRYSNPKGCSNSFSSSIASREDLMYSRPRFWYFTFSRSHRSAWEGFCHIAGNEIFCSYHTCSYQCPISHHTNTGIFCLPPGLCLKRLTIKLSGLIYKIAITIYNIYQIWLDTQFLFFYYFAEFMNSGNTLPDYWQKSVQKKDRQGVPRNCETIWDRKIVT